ncbi:MAG: D-alanyl-D-alanine carboxypeptidase family protein [Hyphomicrobiaceae bacterium]
MVPSTSTAVRAWCRLVIALTAFAIPPLCSPASAASPKANSAQTDVTTKAREAILMDAASGAILFQHRADEPMSPASMSKLMTLALVFKALKAGRLKLDDQVLMSVNAWRRGGAPSGTSAMFVPVKTKETVDNLLQGIIVQSGNDAAIALAEGIAGSEETFAALMTQEARLLGMKNSTFRNATGLYHPEHLTTARDLAILARHLITEYPDQYYRYSVREFPYRKHKFINRNPLLGASLGVDGMKTGHIKEAGYGIVASAKQENRRLILVINGLQRPEERKNEGIRLLEWGFKNISDIKLFDAGQVIGQARVWGGTRMWVPLQAKGDVTIVLPRYPANQKLKAEIIYQGPLKPPLRKGAEVARLRVTSTSNAVSEVPLYAGEDVDGGGVVRRGLDSLLHMAFRWLP